MVSNKSQCSASTKSGNRCKNQALQGLQYCRVHQYSFPVTEVKPITGNHDEYQGFVKDLESLVKELRGVIPEYKLPEYSDQVILQLFLKNIEDLPLNLQIETMRRTRDRNDLAPGIDTQVLHDFWYLLNLRVKKRTSKFSSLIGRAINHLPGGSLINELAMGLDGSSPEDFLDMDTWRGLWMVISNSIQSQLDSVKEQISGKEN